MQGIFKEELKRLLEQFTEMGLDVGEQIYQAPNLLLTTIVS
ncbi:hypothetical protein QY883_08130 [Pediococcus acidilactici]|nr:hypothetical protein [Pediococcus acidilactici]EOA08990.1 phosphate transport system regulatory protein PhoU [Pediococcus acidilactici D3]MCW8083619.1 hypothetical protein [Pediococcus acidilactici]MDB8857810.1 hypothetical protein [Pediococcus acidilactici]MDL2056025.1 hypothetical protein [Pediococcus acidilactici]MDQ7763513.1 hypothetical protein [Pediococcus acidilactici]